MENEKKNPTSEQVSKVNPWELLEMSRNQDGTITRRFVPPKSPPTVDPSATNTTLSKDLPINHQIGTWFRIYLPKFALNNPEYYNKLPVIVYYHGGGFIILHADSQINHELCEQLASTASALVVSVEYRLAPEHRLPAAYHDAIEALTSINQSWVLANHQDWISRYGDSSSCFIMGSSAGGNKAYHAGLRATELNLNPLKIRGLILHIPFFGGMDRVESERRLWNNPQLPVSGTDLLWELSLPEGADRDHEYSNPIKGVGSGQLDQVKELGWRVLLTGCNGDPLIDRQVELAKVMEEKGISVVTHFTKGGYHGADMFDPTLITSFMEVVKNFIVYTLNRIPHRL